MRIIIEDRDDWILQVKAARSALKDGIELNGIYGISFEGGASYGVKRNKDSVRVYPQDKQP